MDAHPRAFANPISRANTNSCDLRVGCTWDCRSGRGRRGAMPGIRVDVVNDRGACAAPIRTATLCASDARKDRFITDLKLAIPWPCCTGSSISTFICPSGRQAHHF